MALLEAPQIETEPERCVEPERCAEPERCIRFRGAASDLLHTQSPEVLIEGPAGTGKTLACLSKCVHVCENVPGARVLLCRATRVSLTQSALVTLERQLLDEQHISRVISTATRAHRSSYSFPSSRAELVVAGLDDTQRVMSSEYDLIYVAESTEISEEDWERLLTRLRNHAMDYQQAIADCNPGPPSHFLNQRAARGQMLRLLSRHADNPSITPEYLSTLRGLTGHRRARLYEGRWVAGEGAVFPEFDVERHVLKPFDVPREWPVYLGYDPGYSHVTAVLWFAVAPNEALYIIDEIYQAGRSVQEHAKEIHRRCGGRNMRKFYADPQYAFSRTAMSPKTIAQQLRECGLNFSPWPRTGGNEIAMVEQVRKRLIDGKLKVFSTCAGTISEFQSWSYKRTATGELPPGDDKFNDIGNDAMDVVRGVVAANPRHTLGTIRVVGPPTD